MSENDDEYQLIISEILFDTDFFLPFTYTMENCCNIA